MIVVVVEKRHSCNSVTTVYKTSKQEVDRREKASWNRLMILIGCRK
jgi:hypothetical protein